MPKSYTAQTLAGNFDPYQAPTPFMVTVTSVAVDDNDEDGVITPNSFDQIGGSDITSVYDGDTIEYSNGTIVTGITFYTAGGDIYFVPHTGQTLINGTIVDTSWESTSTSAPVGTIETTPPCFVAGTLILTPTGEVPVEDLKAGDLVMTRDRGAQPVRWVRSRTISGEGLFAPVRIQAGTLGNSRDLFVSPQHRMAVEDWRAELYCGEETLLCSAIGLCNDKNITRAPRETVTYVHLMFDQHEIIYAEGAPSESFFVGDYLTDESSAAYQELIALFPELATEARNWQPAARMARRAETSVITSSLALH